MKIIFLRGCPGVGKSSVAERLRNHLDGEYIEVDSFKRELRKRSPDTIFGACCVYAYKMTRNRLMKLIGDAEYVIVDEILYDQAFLQILSEFCCQNDLKPFWFTLTRDIETLLSIEKLRDRKIKNSSGDFIRFAYHLN